MSSAPKAEDRTPSQIFGKGSFFFGSPEDLAVILLPSTPHLRTMSTPVKVLNTSPYPLPAYQTSGSAGVDLRAHLQEPLSLKPLERRLIPTGLFIEIPFGYEGQVRPRSGLSIKRGLTCVNAVGTVDSDYRGELMVPIINLSEETQIIEPGERIAQLVLAKHGHIDWQPVLELEPSDRNAGGFGSTGSR